jgi:GGDEF domain-containing protein
LVDEKLNEIIQRGRWSLILVSIINLDIFRDAYGFVASDDVLRAISLMIHNAMREVGDADDFVGHLTPTDFVLVVSPGNLSALQERVRTRLEQSLDYFYPIKDRDRASKSKDRLVIKVLEVPAGRGRYNEVDSLKKELLRLIR